MNNSKILNETKIYVLAFFCIALLAFDTAAQTSAFAQQAKLEAADGVAQDALGFAAAISGDTAIVGAPRNRGTGQQSASKRGAAYIYIRSGTTWTLQQKITASDATDSDQFGYAVAINGNTVAVGRQNTDLTNRSDGKVYIFTRAGTTWTETQTIVSNDLAQADQFGSSLAFDGDTLVAGAYVKNNGSTIFQGAAYVFTRPANGGSFTQQAKLLASDGVLADYFGYRVAISGDTIAASSPGQVGLSNSPGKGYIFVRSGATWTQQQILQPSDGAVGDSFGFSAAIDGDTAVFGASLDSTGNTSAHGSAYIYSRSGAMWTQQQKINQPAISTNDFFGYSVAVRGNTIAVGATGIDFPPNNNNGAIFIFARSGSVWTQTQRLVQNDLGAISIGGSLAFEGNSIISGAFSNSTDKGSAYVFVTNGTTSAANRIADFDGDGKSDLSVFRPSSGTWYLLRSQAGFTSTAFGISNDKLTPADFDGDGKTDIAVFRDGTWYLQKSQAGFTAISFGTSGDFPVPADYDGDGKADLAVFRPSNGTWYRLNSSNNQYVVVQFGTSGDNPTVGDFDGDGKNDIAVFRPSNGMWYRLNSSNNQFIAVQFGTTNDLVVPADYDGDGKADIAVYRPANGTWYRLNSLNGQFVAVQFGISTDKPAPADYDGDGKADIAVFRDGVWYLLQSLNNGLTTVGFGIGGDLPAPNAYVR